MPIKKPDVITGSMNHHPMEVAESGWGPVMIVRHTTAQGRSPGF